MNLSRRAEVAAKWSRTASTEGVSSRWTCSNNNASNLSSSIFSGIWPTAACQRRLPAHHNPSPPLGSRSTWYKHKYLNVFEYTQRHNHILCFYRKRLFFCLCSLGGGARPQAPLWLRPPPWTSLEYEKWSTEINLEYRLRLKNKGNKT